METITVYLESPWTRQGDNFEAPCTLMVEGVHSGSHGPIYHAAHVLKANAHKWEGQPVTLDRPQENGEFVDVNTSKAIWNKYVIGRVTKPYYDNSKNGIRATLQIPADLPLAQEVMKLKEVSVGIYGNETETYGSWNGQEYDKCAITHEPNHLAILDSQGACSFKKGCGIRTNEKGRDTMGSYEHEAVYPPEVYEAEFLEQQKAKQPEQDHEAEAVFPPEVA
jgi:hypothetical protein